MGGGVGGGQIECKRGLFVTDTESESHRQIWWGREDKLFFFKYKLWLQNLLKVDEMSADCSTQIVLWCHDPLSQMM